MSTVVVPIETSLKDLLEPISKSTGNSFAAFAFGKSLNQKQLICDIGLKDNDKMLLWPLTKAMKPEGVRWWCRFPVHSTDNIQTSTNSQAICFIP